MYVNQLTLALVEKLTLKIEELRFEFNHYDFKHD